MKRPADRRSFTYRLYCDLVAERKNGNRKRLAVTNVARKWGAPFGRVCRVWAQYVRPNLDLVHGRVAALF
jgi:hypothetical protein